MTPVSLNGLSLLELDRNLFRNVVSLRRSQDLFDDLSDDPADWEAAIALELDSKPDGHRSPQPIIDRPFEEAAFVAAVEFPFDNWSHSRFSRGRYGVWYGSESLETTVHETIHHWRYGFLADAGLADQEGATIERRVYRVHCRGALINLVSKQSEWPELCADDHDFCQALGERIHHEGHPGIWTPSARCAGINAALFTPRLLSAPRNYCYLTYRIEQGSVTVRRNLKRVLMTV